MRNSLATPLKVYLCGSDLVGRVVNQMYPAFADSSRFEIISMTSTWSHVLTDVPSLRPDILVIDASIAPSLEDLRRFLSFVIEKRQQAICLQVIPEEKEGEEEWTSEVMDEIVFLSPYPITIWDLPVLWAEVALYSYSLFEELENFKARQESQTEAFAETTK